jgi:glucose/arabinose dehydrogenase
MHARRAVVAAALTAVVALVLTGCGGGNGGGGDTGPSTRTAAPRPSQSATTGGSPSTSPSATRPAVIGTIADHLAVPWGVAFLPDGSALVTERDTGRVLHLTGSGSRWRARQVGRLAAEGAPGTESGLLGVAVSPTYSSDGRVFFYVTTATDNRIVRARFAGDRLTDEHAVLTGIPRGPIHDGGRLVFGPDGYLYASTGETGDRDLAQDRSSLGGKILRLTQDGKAAPGNPDGSRIWTLGHRNVQGLAFDPGGRLWASEFGEQTWDELNLIRKGGNYGWPLVEGRGHLDRFRNPLVVWRTDQASPSGLAYADGALWLGALHGERLWQVPLHGASVGTPQDWFVGRYGRMRTVVRAPDGNLWVTTSNRDGRGSPAPDDDRILLVRP